MSKYSYVILNVKTLNLGKIEDINGKEIVEGNIYNALHNGNVIYIYRGSKSKKVYIGQTKHFLSRNREHYSGNEEKFNEANFDEVIVIFSVYFNGSALDDVEQQLITYFIADNSHSRSQRIAFDNKEVINLTGGNSVNEYMEREKVASDVILPLWEQVLYPEWVNTNTIEELRSQELVKYSPIKKLTQQQQEIIGDIITNENKSYVINGDAGTGKTVLLTHIVAKLFETKPTTRVAVVVQRNWLKTAQKIFEVYGLSSSNLIVATSTTLIKKAEHFDVIIVDEAHRISRKYNNQNPSFNTVYQQAEFVNCQSHLEILQKLGKQIVLMYDVLQAIRPANITREEFRRLTKDYSQRYLTTQFRIQGSNKNGFTSEDYINGIKYLLYKDTGLLAYTNFNENFNRDLFKDKGEDAYFGYFTDHPLHNLIDWIEEDRNFHPENINRVLAGLVEPWKQADGKKKEVTHWHEGDLSRRWNATQENWIHSQNDDAEDQIGSVFAVQGIDLNKVGVLIGNDLQIDESGKLYANPDNFFNDKGKFTKSDAVDPKNKKEFTLFVLNIYYVLLTRGIDGIRVGFWKNDDFRKYMEKTLDIK